MDPPTDSKAAPPQRRKVILIVGAVVVLVAVIGTVVGVVVSRNNTSSSSSSTSAPSTPGATPTTPFQYRPFTTPGVIGYWANWGTASQPENTIDKLNLEGFDTIIYSFIFPTADGNIIPSWSYVNKSVILDASADDAKWIPIFNGLRSKYPKLRTVVSIGGWTGSTNFSSIAASKIYSANFAKNIHAFIDANGFDGVDLDWEYPGGGAIDCLQYTADDAANFINILSALRAELGPTRHISIAAGADSSRYNVGAKNYVSEYAKYVSYFGLMTYDITGAWLGTSDFNSPLGVPGPNNKQDPNGEYAIQNYVASWTSSGVNKSQIVTGLAFYGRAMSVVSQGTQNGLYQPCTSAANSDPASTFATPCAPVIGDYLDGPSYDTCGILGGYNTQWMYYSLRGAFGRQSPAPLANGPDSPALGWSYQYFEYAASATLFTTQYRNYTNYFIGYDDTFSIRAKSAWAKASGLGGVMAWELSSDYKGELAAAAVAGPFTTPGVIGYWANWGTKTQPENTIDKLNLTGFDAIIYSFVFPSANGTIIPAWTYVQDPITGKLGINDSSKDDAVWIPIFNGPVRDKYPNMRTVISVGGWTGGSNFSSIAASPEYTVNFAKNLHTYLDTYGFDGVDLDWEFPGGEYAKYVSYFGLMTYDIYGSWNAYSDFNSPLGAPGMGDPIEPAANSGPQTIQTFVQGWLDRGVPACQLVTGIAFYGRSMSVLHQGDTNGLYQPCLSTFNAQPNNTSPIPCDTVYGDYLDAKPPCDTCGSCGGLSGQWMYYSLRGGFGRQTQAPLVNGPRNVAKGWDFEYFQYAESATVFAAKYRDYQNYFIGYDDPISVKAKAAWSYEAGLGGAMVWELSSDYQGELAQAVVEGWTN
ncbi:glycoside hydrolase [Rhizoclosmatium globosum]|uniref:Glycoside hydrolase n=1 Tax=Rhizoclosmatium globosum TaxID=329046 RepID=A0A1Y2CL31_9FUNG|nr:glycoside hydrolase [Rhizoclosmatium globosum]|eukprot:ORY47749.1 glycoside hydrolase [Rhizoclosmatium globosum]